MLTRMIKRAQHDGGLSGLPMGPGQCKLGQLMHADDCLLLARASREEAGVVGNVLKVYGRLIGQRVNGKI